MRPNNIKTVLATIFNSTKRTVCLEGPPGGGKTTVVKQVAEELGVPCIVKHMPTMLVEDFGILFPNGDDKLHYKLPDWFPVKGAAPDRGILLFDDSNQAAPDLQKVMANICQDRTLHGYAMPEGWMVIRTGNRQSDRAGANRVLSHLRNRETVLEFEANLDDWTEWAIGEGVHPVGISFLQMRADMLYGEKGFDPSRDVHPTPRSWTEGVFALMDMLPPEVEFDTFKGAVGEGEAAEFVGFLRTYRNMVDPEECIKNPTKAPVPSDSATRYALCAALAHKATEDNFAHVCAYMSRLPPEFSILCFRQAIRLTPEVAQTDAWGKWALDNLDLIKV